MIEATVEMLKYLRDIKDSLESLEEPVAASTMTKLSKLYDVLVDLLSSLGELGEPHMKDTILMEMRNLTSNALKKANHLDTVLPRSVKDFRSKVQDKLHDLSHIIFAKGVVPSSLLNAPFNRPDNQTGPSNPPGAQTGPSNPPGSSRLDPVTTRLMMMTTVRRRID